jgi:hypothetical protein
VAQGVDVENEGRRGTRRWRASALSAALCLSVSTVILAADSNSAPARRAAGRTALPGCAKLVCQRRPPAPESAEPQHGDARSASPLRVRVGLGAGGFFAPLAPGGFYPEQFFADARLSDIEAANAATYRPKITGVTVSLGVSLEQELSDAAAWRWGLEERLSLVTVVPLQGPSGSAIGGVADLLFGARASALPLRAAIGPSLAAAQLHVEDEDITLDHPAVFAGGAASLRWDATALLSLDVTGHLATSLNYEADAAYRDLQLVVSVGM